MKIHWLVILLIAACSCKSPEEKLSGKWKIKSYTYHGADSMAQLNRLHQNDIILLTENMPDPMGGWGITSTHLDTIFSFGGRWQLYKKNELRFYLLSTSVYKNGKAIRAWNTFFDTAIMPPFVFLYNDWKIERQGNESLKLSAVNDKEIKLELRRQ